MDSRGMHNMMPTALLKHTLICSNLKYERFSYENMLLSVCQSFFFMTEVYDEEIVGLAGLVIPKHLFSGENSVKVIIDVVARGSQEDTGRLCSLILQLWLESTVEKMQTDDDQGIYGSVNLVENAFVGGSIPLIEIELTIIEREKVPLFNKVCDSNFALSRTIKLTVAYALGGDKRRAILDTGVDCWC